MYSPVDKEKCGCRAFMNFSALCRKQVINIRDGKCLGYFADCDIDILSGRITRFMLPKPSKWIVHYNRDNCLIVKWDNIDKIGEDAVLINCYEIYCKKEKKKCR